ncbi:MAG: hypothetical protein KF690_03520 [Bacteroidetes bacterium]|nr:hypothetical protein [Bacteroidota bacterium]
MLRRTARFFLALQYALPLQLLFTQVRTHKLVLLSWLFITLVITGNALSALGASYLFLEPEYRNHADFAAMFILGISFGIFSLAYQMTCYILDGYRFFFLGLERRPFMTFSINNSVVPSLFWLIYIFSYLSFHLRNDEFSLLSILYHLSGALLGGVLVTTFSIIYFSLRNKDIVRLFGERIVEELRNPRVIMREARRTMGQLIRVDWYLSKLFRIERVQPNIRGDLRYLVKVLNQNQANALILQVFLFLLLAVLGVFQENAFFRIPAGASFMLLFSFILMIIGALTFWLRKMGPLTILVLLLLLVFLNQFRPFIGDNYAFGLNYNRAFATYDHTSLEKLTTPALVEEDSLRTIATLNYWLARNATPDNPRPPVILLCVSGGGNRSALWTLHALRTLHRQTDGEINRRLMLVTGASGGMIGAAYWREMLRLQTQKKAVNLMDTNHLVNVSKDLLNSPVLNLTVNLLLPNLAWELDEHRYEKDRGYAWEHQLKENIPVFQGLRLSDYALAESTAAVPMMIFSPTIGNDGRHLFISPHPKSYLMRPHRFNDSYVNEISGVDFQRLFASQGAQHLNYTTAIRMNATFPTILPYVELPTQPAISVLDAGVLDNFGISTAVRFLYIFRHWMAQHAGQVILIQVRDTPSIVPPEPVEGKTLLGKIGILFGSPLKGYSKGRDFLNREVLARVGSWLNIPLQVVQLQYIPHDRYKGAALSFHLTEREKQDILKAIHNPDNQQAIRLIKQLLAQKMPAR